MVRAVVAGVGLAGMVSIVLAVLAPRAFPPLPSLGTLPDAALRTHQGTPITLAQLRGRVWVAGFIFTRCAGQCPLITSRMAALQTALPELELVSISVDPVYDTPERLTAYAARAGAGERWRFLTGSPEVILPLVREGFRFAVGQDGTPEEPITHSVRLVLVDQAGVIRGMYDATEAAAMPRLRDDAARLLRESP